LITVPTDYPNIVALYIVVYAGSRNEIEPGKSGFAHLFEHLMFRGTEKFSQEKYNEILKTAGADQNAYTTDDRTVYHTVFSKEDLDQIMSLEADRFQHLQYKEPEFQKEARAVLNRTGRRCETRLRGAAGSCELRRGHPPLSAWGQGRPLRTPGPPLPPWWPPSCQLPRWPSPASRSDR